MPMLVEELNCLVGLLLSRLRVYYLVRDRETELLEQMQDNLTSYLNNHDRLFFSLSLSFWDSPIIYLTFNKVAKEELSCISTSPLWLKQMLSRRFCFRRRYNETSLFHHQGKCCRHSSTIFDLVSTTVRTTLGDYYQASHRLLISTSSYYFSLSIFLINYFKQKRQQQQQ